MDKTSGEFQQNDEDTIGVFSFFVPGMILVINNKLSHNENPHWALVAINQAQQISFYYNKCLITELVK